VKEGVFRKLDEVMKRGAILASNTSTLDLDRIASFTQRPADVIGTHFFSPANVMKLLEIVRGRATGKDVLATVLLLAKKLGKTGVVSGVCDGFIGNRMLARYIEQALLLVEEGALPAQVDAALEKFGMAMGPFRVSDLAGGDVSWFIRKRRYAEHPQGRKQVIADRVCELGRFGQKTGAGWYRYEAGRRDAIPDPIVAGHHALARVVGIAPPAGRGGRRQVVEVGGRLGGGRRGEGRPKCGVGRRRHDLCGRRCGRRARGEEQPEERHEPSASERSGEHLVRLAFAGSRVQNGATGQAVGTGAWAGLIRPARTLSKQVLQ
jgi:hypothetical protein